MRRIIFASMLCALGFAGCKKKPPEVIPQPEVDGQQTAAAAAAPAVSTAPAPEQNPLKAPGSYLKTTVGHIGEAKAARDLYEKTAKQQLNSLDLNNTGGN